MVWQEYEHYTTETFWSFLQKVVAPYPAGKIVIVLDTARILVEWFNSSTNIVESIS